MKIDLQIILELVQNFRLKNARAKYETGI